MEKDCYQEIIEEVSKKLSDKITSEEKGLGHRATLIDRDIGDIVQDIGLKTTKLVLENTRDQIAQKKEEGLVIHRNPMIEFNTIFGKLEISSPYLWLSGIDSSKPLIDEMRICHCGRSEAVNRALSDFGIEESFASAAARFKEHYHYEIGQSAAARSTKNTALQAMDYIENKLSDYDQLQENTFIEKMRSVRVSQT